MSRPTPETDGQPRSIGIGCGGTYSMVNAEFARNLERERDEARNKMADALQEVDLRILDFERMNQECYELRKELEEYRAIAENIGAVKAVSEKEKAIRERDEVREALMKIEEIFINGEDTYLDFVRVGNIARAALKNEKI